MKKILLTVLTVYFGLLGAAYAQKKVASYKVIMDRKLTGNYTLDYDAKNRLVKLEGQHADNEYFSYTYTYESDKIHVKMTGWKNNGRKEEIGTIQMLRDKQGRIAATTITAEGDVVGTSTYYYDKEGRLQRRHLKVAQDDGDEKMDVFTWTKGNITSLKFPPFIRPFNEWEGTLKYEENKTPAGLNYFWPVTMVEQNFSPYWPLYLLGYFGKAPDNLIASIKIKEDDDPNSESVYIRYMMDSDGYPIEIRMFEEIDKAPEVIILFTYK